MATFVLVPGAFHGGWCYDLLRPHLEQAGHKVLTPTLSGVGERAHLAHQGLIDLETHILDIFNLIQHRDLRDVVLCGHSYGAFVTTGVADRVPDRIAALVYIDGMIPQDGDTLFSVLPNLAIPFTKLASGHGGRLVAPLSAATFGVGASHQVWVDSRLTPHPLPCFTQPIKLNGSSRKIKTNVFVYNSRDIGLPSPIPDQYESFRDKDGHHVFSLSGGHDLMIDSAEDLARIMLEFA
ncbi:alpha/beta hydrolase [Mesorhizobium sp. NZP2234]|jgi:pimeloyl-ACP methyl ester carboxylesterase|uniref:alpha/beta hydrolase n=1 Tax=Mesorhizobium sp. NZP2234 TaxID=2483402 RepID=UPI0015542B28|nr:alpha/beta hydrolase [Mesorhizobium sp. NZP2234]